MNDGSFTVYFMMLNTNHRLFHNVVNRGLNVPTFIQYQFDRGLNRTVIEFGLNNLFGYHFGLNNLFNRGLNRTFIQPSYQFVTTR